MLSNKEIYEIADKLGMIDLGDKCSDARDTRSAAEQFEQDTCSDLCFISNFVDELTIYNDLETLKKFLVIVLAENQKKGN